jgi:hypothetical protein
MYMYTDGIGTTKQLSKWQRNLLYANLRESLVADGRMVSYKHN